MALAVCNKMARLPLVQRDVDVHFFEAVDVDGSKVIESDGWKETASGFIPVERLVVVFTGCPDSWLGFGFGSFDVDCCLSQMLP